MYIVKYKYYKKENVYYQTADLRKRLFHHGRFINTSRIFSSTCNNLKGFESVVSILPQLDESTLVPFDEAYPASSIETICAGRALALHAMNGSLEMSVPWHGER